MGRVTWVGHVEVTLVWSGSRAGHVQVTWFGSRAQGHVEVTLVGSGSRAGHSMVVSICYGLSSTEVGYGATRNIWY
eukprot:1871577-Rhodomonas_salina.1